MLRRVGETVDSKDAVVKIKDASFPTPFVSALEYNSPVHGNWNIVHTGMQVPESIQIYVCADNCMRGVVLTAAEMNAADRFSFVLVEEQNLLSGNLEDITIEGVTDVLNKRKDHPEAVLLFTVCLHHFVGSNLNYIYRELEHRFPDICFIRCYMDPIMQKHGLTPEQLKISKGAIWKIARNYTKEAGVRQLERKIGDICRKSAREILETGKSSIRATERNLEKYLGKEKYSYQMINETDEIGIVRGLAWTSVGGDTLQTEVNIMPGEGEILLTGQLGDVMKESARTGISYIRSVGEKYKISEDFFKKHDIHIHIPEGAVPKDGPSAGITMATAMISAITNTKVRADVAMTGEITLRGRVLPIGGLKEKLLAAKSAGVKTVLVPEKNMRDVEEISSEITRGLEIIPVSYMDEVLKTALIYEENENEN